MSKLWLLLPVLMLLMGCDPEHKEKCEWYLVPEPKHIDLVPEGWVSLCARNFVMNRQRCYLKANLDMAKAMHDKTFRFSQMKVDDKGPFPREVLSIKTCTPEPEEVARRAKAGQ